MPYIQGETIREKLNRETQFGVDEAVRIAREVADALDYAHRHGVIHRDIKPENILLHDGRAMVMDFGIALAVSAAAGGRMTETGLSLGTPHYMSPEQATAEKEITARSDVYSLASVLYEMLAGQPPHIGGAAQQVIMKIITEPARPVTTLRKSVPPNVAAALAKALEKLPADRFESAKAFADALGNPEFTGSSVKRRRPAPLRAKLAHRNRAVGDDRRCGRAPLRESYDRRDVPGRRRVPVGELSARQRCVHIALASTRPFAISPDGRTIVFRGWTDNTTPHLWVRTIGDPEAHTGSRARKTDRTPPSRPMARPSPFIVQNRQLTVLPIAGGAVRNITTLDGLPQPSTRACNDQILFE